MQFGLIFTNPVTYIVDRNWPSSYRYEGFKMVTSSVPVNGTLVSYASFLATNTWLCVLIISKSTLIEQSFTTKILPVNIVAFNHYNILT